MTRDTVTMGSMIGDNDVYEAVTEKHRADSYHGFSDGLHTIQTTFHDFTGKFYIQATLVLDPQEDDWFFIKLGAQNMKEYTADTTTEAFSFVGNFMWLRVGIDRNYLQSNQTGLGVIDKALLSL